jgi:hypothetical protein
MVNGSLAAFSARISGELSELTVLSLKKKSLAGRFWKEANACSGSWATRRNGRESKKRKAANRCRCIV